MKERKSQKAECSPDAWEMLKAGYFRAEAPPFSVCYRHLEMISSEKAWVIPSPSTLRRRLNAEIKRRKRKARRGTL